MTRSELIARLSARFPALTVKDAAESVSVILTGIANSLAGGGRAEIRGYGAFSVNLRPPRLGRNPATGASVPVPAKHVPHFKPGKELRDRVAASAKSEKPIAGKHQRTRATAELTPLV
jgi:integration host factor subunit beta